LINNDGSDSKTSGGKKGVRWQREGRITSDWLQESRGRRGAGRGPGKTSGCEASRTIEK